jgi:YD repeat-containing protein
VRDVTRFVDINGVQTNIERVYDVLCRFDRSTNRLTCRETPRDGGAYTDVVNEYASLTDFVGEAQVVPPLTLASRTITSEIAGGSVTTVTRNYNAGKLQAEETSSVLMPTGASAGSESATYSSWDDAGRVRTGVLRSGREVRDRTYDYDAQGRRVFRHDVSPYAVYDNTNLFDQFGNLSSYSFTMDAPGSMFVRIAWSIELTAFERVCQ